MSEPKFKVHDRVKIITVGYGCHSDTVGKIVTISKTGLTYGDQPGYRIKETDLITNCKYTPIGIGESSFELVSRPKYSIGDEVKVCGIRECNGYGFVCKPDNSSLLRDFQRIRGVADYKSKIIDIHWVEDRQEYYYELLNMPYPGYIAEHALSLLTKAEQPEVTSFFTIDQDPPSKYLECLNNAVSYMVKGRIYEYVGKDSQHFRVKCNVKCGPYAAGSTLHEDPWNFKASTKEAYDAQLLPAEDPLIVEARKRYPVGTKFRPAHLSDETSYCVVTNKDFKIQGGAIYVYTDEGKQNSISHRYGNGGYERMVYYKGRWADVVGVVPVATAEPQSGEVAIWAWLDETKKKNLSLKELEDYIADQDDCPFEIYRILEGGGPRKKAEILFNGWNSKSRFKVGDRVIVNKNRYAITCKGWRGVVIELCKDGRSVIVADVVDPSETYTVDSKYFDHDTSDAEPKEVTTTFNNPKTKNNVNKQQSNREEQRQVNREEPYKQISCKVPGPHLKISAGGRVRGVGLKSARVQISIGSNNRYNKQGSVSGQKKTGRGSASFPL